MGFSSLLGQATVVQTLERALSTGHVHHAYRFEGPDGVGKELAALRLAQALVCETGNPFGCETCSASAARVMPPPSTTARNSRSLRRSIGKGYVKDKNYVLDLSVMSADHEG